MVNFILAKTSVFHSLDNAFFSNGLDGYSYQEEIFSSPVKFVLFFYFYIEGIQILPQDRCHFFTTQNLIRSKYTVTHSCHNTHFKRPIDISTLKSIGFDNLKSHLFIGLLIDFSLCQIISHGTGQRDGKHVPRLRHIVGVGFI